MKPTTANTSRRIHLVDALEWRLGRHALIGEGAASVTDAVERVVATRAWPAESGRPDRRLTASRPKARCLEPGAGVQDLGKKLRIPRRFLHLHPFYRHRSADDTNRDPDMGNKAVAGTRRLHDQRLAAVTRGTTRNPRRRANDSLTDQRKPPQDPRLTPPRAGGLWERF